MSKRGPKSEFSRYAYGWSDQKPHWTFWLAPGLMLATVVIALLMRFEP